MAQERETLRRERISSGMEDWDPQSQGTYTRGMFGEGNGMQKAYERAGGTSWSTATGTPSE